jgi:hypothetical protein
MNSLPEKTDQPYFEEDTEEDEEEEAFGEEDFEEEEDMERGNRMEGIRRILVKEGFQFMNVKSVKEGRARQIWIPKSAEHLYSSCFKSHRLLSSISFESNSVLKRIESYAFSSSSLQSIVIPRSVEILGSSCFSYCKSLSSISFESNSGLKRIESSAFSESSLKSIEIPRNVQFINGSAFESTQLNSISIEAGNDIFHIEHDFLIDILHHKLIRNFSISSHIEIPRTIEILGSSCFSSCKSLLSISFESNSGLKRIESSAFSSSSLQSIEIPRSM